MRYKELTAVLIGMCALCMTGCRSSRQMTVAKSAERSVLTVESEKKIERVDSVVVEQRDTLREVTTQTIMTNTRLCIDSRFDVKASREINGFKAGFRVGFKVDNGYCLNPSCHGSARACTALMFGFTSLQDYRRQIVLKYR